MIAALVLGGCVAAPSKPGAALFRKPGEPIYSSAAFNPGRLVGTWRQAASFAAGEDAGCGPGRAEFTATPAGLSVNALLCLNGRQVRSVGVVRSSGPGRIVVPEMGEWWVLWVDEGYRTLAIGTPSGAYGFILDRARLPQDRLFAAREIFDFNGYPAGRLQAF